PEPVCLLASVAGVHPGWNQRTRYSRAGGAHLQLLRLPTALVRRTLHSVLWNARGQLFLAGGAAQRCECRSTVSTADQLGCADHDYSLRGFNGFRGTGDWVAYGHRRVRPHLRFADAGIRLGVWTRWKGPCSKVPGTKVRPRTAPWRNEPRA